MTAPLRRAAPAAVALWACTHVPLSTMYRMRSFDAATADPSVLRAAVRIPDVLEPTPGGVRLVVRYPADEGGGERTEEYVLEETASPADVAPLAGQARAGARIHVFRVRPADVPRIRAVQSEVLRARRTGRGASRGSVTISADPCRRGELPAGSLPLTTYLRTEGGGGFLVLVDDVDLRQLAPKGKDLREVVLACPAAR